MSNESWDFFKAAFFVIALVLWLLFSVAQGQNLPPPVLAGSSTGPGAAVIAITPPAPGLFYRINTWPDYPYPCVCLNPPNGICSWPEANQPPCAATNTWSPPAPALVTDIISPALTQNYSLPTGWTWNFWAQTCTSQTDPNSCGPMSDILSIAL